ncbi:MAG: winged helix-turn-helix domain-containing protein [Candidatus Andersenbacteria bacterium]
MFTRESLTLLGLTSEDNALLKMLEKHDLSVSELARSTHQPRTSVYPRLSRLKERGLVTTTNRGKRRYWKTVSPRKLREKLFMLAHSHEIAEESGEQELGIISSQQSEYKVYAGKNKLVEIYESLGQLPRHTRLHIMQPNISAYSVMKHFPYDRLVKLNQSIKDRKIIVEAILQENFLDYYTDRLKKEGKSSKDILQAYGGRLAITHHVPAERLNFDSEVTLHNDTVIIANWQELVAVVIKNEQAAGLIADIFESLQLLGRKVDQNPRIEEILKNP